MANEITFDVADFQKEMKRVDQEVKRLSDMELEERVDYAVDTLRIVTPIDTGEARSGWKSKKYKDSYGFIGGSILNEVEHIVYLNNGHSKQAPRYFIEQVLTKIGILTPE
ncbi:hypothetical protein N9Z41_02490 [bacterium]|nr:hypothetical protein [bacterium]